jgi:hypothetical protein
VKVGIAQEIDSEFERLAGVLTRLDDRLREYFAGRQYGQGISSIIIGVILMGPGSERFHPVRPFKYKKLSKFRSLVTGEQKEMKDVVTLDVKPDYQTLRQLNAEAAESYISNALIGAMNAICSHQEKFPMFDTAKFKEDFTACLRQSSSTL